MSQSRASQRTLITLAICACAMSGAAKAESATVVLQLQSKSWIAGSTFDVEGFTASCSDSGVELVAPATAQAQATAVVIYTEVKGPGFSPFGLGTPVGYGTNISFKLTLIDAKTAETLITLSAAGETPPGLANEAFHHGARQAFQNDPAFHFACSAMAASLGSREQMLRVLSWAVADQRGMALLDRLAFKPETDLERAYVAVARRNFSTLQMLGSAAIEPLLLLFKNSGTNRDGIGRVPASSPENANMLVRAATLLGTFDDERIADALEVFLTDYSDAQSKDDPTLVPVLIAALRTLGRVGTVFSLPMLEEWQDAGGTPIAKEARAAADALRKRLKF